MHWGILGSGGGCEHVTCVGSFPSSWKCTAVLLYALLLVYRLLLYISLICFIGLFEQLLISGNGLNMTVAVRYKKKQQSNQLLVTPSERVMLV